MLPADMARCAGSGSDTEGWREGCEDCLRRLAPPCAERQVWIEPPDIIAFWCSYHLSDHDRA